MNKEQLIVLLSLGVAIALPIFAFIVTGAAKAYAGRHRASTRAIQTGNVSLLREKRIDATVFGHDWTLALFTLICGAFLSVKKHLQTITGWPEEAVLGLCVLILVFLLCSYSGMVYFLARMSDNRQLLSRLVSGTINSLALSLYFIALYTVFIASLKLY